MIVVIDPFNISLSLRVLTMARRVTNSPVHAIMFGGQPICDQGISKIYMIHSSNMCRFVTMPYVDVVSRIIREDGTDIVLFPSSDFCRSVASRVAARLNCGLTADCVDIKFENGQLLQIAPAFSGNALATIVSDGICMATVLTTEKIENLPTSSPEIVDVQNPNQIIYKSKSSVTNRHLLVDNADIVLSVGYGIGSKENFDKVCILAGKMGASVGATLAAVNAGFAPNECLIGQTGTLVSPRIYVALGISGHVQHTVGIATSSTIVSVNTDPACAMSLMADYAIVADAAETVDNMLTRYE